jgi:hypothetical protein
MREIKVRNIIFPIPVCDICFKKIGGEELQKEEKET